MELYLDTADVTAVKRTAHSAAARRYHQPEHRGEGSKPIWEVLPARACPRRHRQAVRAGDGGRCRAHGGGGGAAQPARTGAGGEDPGNRRGAGSDQEA